MTNTYQISYIEIVGDETKKRMQRVIVGQQTAKNGIAAIKTLLRSKCDGDAELLAEIEAARTLGSNKRLYLDRVGLTFEADKVSV